MANMNTTVHAAAAGAVRIGDLTVNRLGFGAMRLAGPGIWGRPRNAENVVRVLRLALDLGVTFIDTSDAYGPDVNEEQIAEALHPYPAGLLIATKGGLARPGPGSWDPDCRPERLKRCCEASLQRLKVDRIDLYQLHAVDQRVPYAEQIGALADLQREGKIRHIGLSNVDEEHLRIARSIVPIVSVQNRYNVADREAEIVLKACERDGLAFIPWFPLEAGSIDRHAGLQVLAREKERPVYQLALAWLLKRSPFMLPIPGTASLEHLRENVAAASIVLSDAEFERIAATKRG
jgi:aryl-alcohol dehydrogenase-like predicted oxidoreductase